jgi:hypothetical protein
MTHSLFDPRPDREHSQANFRTLLVALAITCAHRHSQSLVATLLGNVALADAPILGVPRSRQNAAGRSLATAPNLMSIGIGDRRASFP